MPDFFQLLLCNSLGLGAVAIGVLKHQEFANLIKGETPLLGVDDELQPGDRILGVTTIIRMCSGLILTITLK